MAERHDGTGRTGGEDARTGPALELDAHPLLEIAHAQVQLAHAVLEFEDAGDGGQPHAVGRHPRDFAQLLDVPQRIAARSALRAGGDDEAEAVVLAQGLRVHARELGGGRDREDRRVLVDVVLLTHANHRPRSLRTGVPANAGCRPAGVILSAPEHLFSVMI